MDKKRIVITAAAAAISVLVMTAGGTSPGAAMTAAVGAAQHAAYFSAGIKLPETSAQTSAAEEAPEHSAESAEPEELPSTDVNGTAEVTSGTYSSESLEAAVRDIVDAAVSSDVPEVTQEPENKAQVISRNIMEFDDGIDRTAEGNVSGTTVREQFTGYQGTDYIKLPGGGLVWNCTNDSAESISEAGSTLPELRIELNSPEPQVLIVHTHTTESYEPYQRSYYDSDYPCRTRDPRYNMIRVGEVLAQRLADNGISVLHDGTIHDYPTYTGSYDRSEVTIRAALVEYPSIKVIIDLHRDAISGNGVRTAPYAEIDGKSAAQFMMITGCDDGRFGNMPEYRQNLSLACLIQQSAEKLYPGLARPVLFDYRNYNQHISTGSLLIEIGSHANSLDEALYTAELLGDCMSDALVKLAE